MVFSARAYCNRLQLARGFLGAPPYVHREGDALLVLSAMQGLGSFTRRDNYLDSIIFAMEADKPFRVRHAALRAVFDARFRLVDQEEGAFRKKLLTGLPPALFNAAKPIAPQRSNDEPDAVFNHKRDDCYLRLIFTLAKQSDWRAHLERTGHIERCISLIAHIIKNAPTDSSTPHKHHATNLNHPYYLAGTMIRINVSGDYRSPGFAVNMSEQEWWELLKEAWSAMHWNDLYSEDETMEALPGIVTYTLDLLETPTARYEAASLARWVDRIYKALEDDEAKPDILSAVKKL